VVGTGIATWECNGLWDIKLLKTRDNLQTVLDHVSVLRGGLFLPVPGVLYVPHGSVNSTAATRLNDRHSAQRGTRLYTVVVVGEATRTDRPSTAARLNRPRRGPADARRRPTAVAA